MNSSKIRNRLLKVIELMNGVAVVTPRKKRVRKTGLDKALEDVEAGRVYKAKDVDDLFMQISPKVRRLVGRIPVSYSDEELEQMKEEYLTEKYGL